MASVTWNQPRTEDGLRRVLEQLEQCRSDGNKRETGNGLLALSFMVKWVRSDTEAPPFLRSHELALEALAIFRQVDDKKGLVQSLIATSALAQLAQSEELLSEALSVASEMEDENLVAGVLAARGRKLAMFEPKQAGEFQQRALDLYKKTGNEMGQAECLMSLSIIPGSRPLKRTSALEAADLFRKHENYADASRCLTLALMNAKDVSPDELEVIAMQGLADSQKAGQRSQEGFFYGELSNIAEAKNDLGAAAKYKRWADEIKAGERMSRPDRREKDAEFIKSMVSLSGSQGHKKFAKSLKKELRRIKHTGLED